MSDIVERLRMADVYREVFDHLNRPYGLIKSLDQEAADEIEKLRVERDALRAALQSVMVGGNHLACVIGPNHLLHSASYEDALKHYGPGDIYDVWCCWKNIMETRAALGEKG
jgi:hypothetical protein